MWSNVEMYIIFSTATNLWLRTLKGIGWECQKISMLENETFGGLASHRIWNAWIAEEEVEVVPVNNPNVAIIWCYNNFLIWLGKC